MTEYRKKPVVIDAVQWFRDGDNPDVRPYFADEWSRKHGDCCVERDCSKCGHATRIHGWIDTLEGGNDGAQVVCPGDWIITGVKGEKYPCKADVFALTYEPAVQPPPSETKLSDNQRQMTPDELEAHGYPRDYHERRFALPPLADSQEAMEGIAPDGEIRGREWDCGCESACCCERPEPPAPNDGIKKALFAFQEAICEVERCECESMPCEHVVECRAARSSLESLYRGQSEKLEAANQDLETLQDQIASKWDEGFRDGQDLMEAELSALRSLQLTPRQGFALRYITEDTGIPPEELSVEEIADALKKLRISSKATSEEL